MPVRRRPAADQKRFVAANQLRCHIEQFRAQAVAFHRADSHAVAAGLQRPIPGAARGPKSGIDSFLKSGLMSGPLRENFMYAVLETGSKQYRVAAGDTLEIERLETEAGKPVTFDRVLLVNNDGKVTIGAPTVTGATVAADVVAHKRGEKKLTFKLKRRKGYRKAIGHRQELTVVKITAINA
jgi:large subunit ribosomal protein L21